MKKQLFDELVHSVKEAGSIHRGEAKPSREFVFNPETSVPEPQDMTKVNSNEPNDEMRGEYDFGGADDKNPAD